MAEKPTPEIQKLSQAPGTPANREVGVAMAREAAKLTTQHETSPQQPETPSQTLEQRQAGLTDEQLRNLERMQEENKQARAAGEGQKNVILPSQRHHPDFGDMARMESPAQATRAPQKPDKKRVGF